MSINVSAHAAFFMEGLHEADYSKVIAACNNQNMGVIEMVLGIVVYADFIENVLTLIGDEESYPGVFDYEVSSPFGKWYGEYIIVHNDVPAEKVAKEWIGREIVSFFAQADGEIIHIEKLIKEATHV